MDSLEFVDCLLTSIILLNYKFFTVCRLFINKYYST